MCLKAQRRTGFLRNLPARVFIPLGCSGKGHLHHLVQTPFSKDGTLGALSWYFIYLLLKSFIFHYALNITLTTPAVKPFNVNYHYAT